jgi:hypothetical protein
MKGAFRSIKNFFLPYGSPDRLGLFRLLFGIYLIWLMSGFIPAIPLAFSVEGFNLPLIESSSSGTDKLNEFFARISTPVSVTKAYIFYSVLMACLLLFTVGIWVRAAIFGIIGFLIYYYLIFFHFTECSFDKVNLIILAILFFSPCDEAWSIKSWARTKKGLAGPKSVPLWTQQLICLEISIMYLGTAIYKIFSGAWNGGEVIYYALMGDWSTQLSFWLAGQGLAMGWYDLLVLLVILFEFTAWFMLYNRQWQRLWMVGGFIFHLSNALLLNVWEFMNFPLVYILFLRPQKCS